MSEESPHTQPTQPKSSVPSPSQAPAKPIGDLPPEVMFGAYRPIRLIGEGGMGSVYEAVHSQYERRAAVKVLHPRYARNRKLATRFLNEARAVNIVNHPTLVSIYEFGQLDDGTAYIIMEFIEGVTLHHALRKLHGLPMEGARAMQILRQIASGLAAAHAKVIVHRDLKPTNVMLVADPDLRGGERVKLLDFGIAKIVELDVDQEQSALTATDSLLGTPTYMSPEQCRNPRDVTDRTDVYSLGVMAYEMLTGTQPFRANNDIDTIMRHKMLVPPPVRDLNPVISPDLSEMVGLMLAKSPMERPGAGDIKHMLTALLQAPAASGEHAPIILGSQIVPVPAALLNAGAPSGIRPVVSVGDAPVSPVAATLPIAVPPSVRVQLPPQLQAQAGVANPVYVAGSAPPPVVVSVGAGVVQVQPAAGGETTASQSTAAQSMSATLSTVSGAANALSLESTAQMVHAPQSAVATLALEPPPGPSTGRPISTVATLALDPPAPASPSSSSDPTAMLADKAVAVPAAPPVAARTAMPDAPPPMLSVKVAVASPIASTLVAPPHHGLLDGPTAPPVPTGPPRAPGSGSHISGAAIPAPTARAQSSGTGVLPVTAARADAQAARSRSGSGSGSGTSAVRPVSAGGGSTTLLWVFLSVVITCSVFGVLYILYGPRR